MIEIANETIVLYRPVGQQELELIASSGWTEFPPRLPEQPIFYPVLNEEYATRIARDWNTKYGSRSGFVTRFRVRTDYLQRYEAQIVGGSIHQEYWIPAEDLPEFNRNIVGKIEVIAEFYAPGPRPMKKIVECVPNFSEGRDADKVAQLVAAIRAVPGVAVLDYTMDADHHRSVITYAGEPDAVIEAAVRVARRAIELIDLNDHTGEHPRMGAIDVLPFVPLEGVTMEECVALARRAGARIARELELPVYLYEQAATRPDRVDLAEVRRGEFEGLREEIELNPDRAPDFGAARIHPTAGAVAVGARPPLVAYNINLATDDLSIARKIAQAVRGRDGGLRFVKALGFELKERGQAQVSLNLTSHEATPIHRAFEMVKREAERYGVAITGSEIVGLVPQAALNACADYYLRIENFTEELILENRLRAAFDQGAADEEQDFSRTGSLGTFADEVAAATPTPGGGSVAAYAGALAAALGVQVCRLTIGKKDFEEVEVEVRDILTQLDQLGEDLRLAVRDDADSFERVIAALRLPRGSEASELARASAIEEASKGAVAVPLRVAENAMQVLELLDELAEICHPRIFSDLAVGAQMALTAIRGAGYNALANLASISEPEYARDRRAEVEELITHGQEIADEIEGRFFRLQSGKDSLN